MARKMKVTMVIASSNVGFSSDFVDVWHTIQTKEEKQLFHDF